ncbi:MAG TPA: hypothetical protein VK106_00450, partial [Balneolaceae bacterium]|nr:hypothetical protein [Balneolaceae bacterium]
FTKVGMPEGLYFLAHSCIYLALAPKSNSTSAIFRAQRHIKDEGIKPPPEYLRDKTANTKQAKHFDIKNASDDYKYAHSFPNHWVDQRYLPEGVDMQAYKAGSIGKERKLWKRLQKIKEEAIK